MRKIKLGIIGSGNIVRNFIDAAQSIIDCEIYAFYSRNIDTAKEFQSQYNIPNIYTDIDEMSQNPLLDAVYIASPNSLHYSQTIKFLENKKHVLCEKAFASNKKEVQSMIQTAKDNNVLLMEAMRLTVLPNFIQVKGNIHKIGKIRRYFSSYCQYSSRYNKYKNGIILNAFKKELSNGALMDIGVYCIHPMITLFGKPDSILSNALFLDSGIDAQGSAIFNYKDIQGTIIYSKISDSHLPTEIQGENGTIIINKINTFKDVKIIYKDGSIEDLTVEQYDNDMYYEIYEFINLIKTGFLSSSLNTLENSSISMEVMDEIRNQINLTFPADIYNNAYQFFLIGIIIKISLCMISILVIL